ncbi:MAG TPA: hypothetical protein VH988_23550 [Thermoanaerobaculia bacterium]|jgi:hypothetical protein|nr:hypothetical protein [Thermoanaerobaculia bacterium]
MVIRQTRDSRDEHAQRGDEIYERTVVPHLKPEDQGKLVLIDVESGDYEMDRNENAAFNRLLTRRPDAQVWLRRVGFDYVHRFGSQRIRPSAER